MPLTVGSLFSGCGGFDIAFERAGCRVAWQVEINKDANAVLVRHWPDVPRHPDVCAVGAQNLTPVDVITFGSPCQDLSVAGRRQGMSGERSGLYFEAIRIIRELGPTWALWENVPGALSSNGGRDFGAALDAMADAGALDIAWRVLDAQWFGVAQRRRRLFLVADFRGERAAQILFESEGGNGDSAAGREAGEGSAADIACGTTFLSHDISPTLDTHAHDGDRRAQGGVMIAHALTAEGADASEDGTGRGTPLVPISFMWQSGVGMGIEHGAVGTMLANQTPAVAIHTTGYQGDRVNDSAGTWTTLPAQNANNGGGAGALLLHRMAVRRLTPTECERLQGFPDGHTAGLSDSARYRLMGNAVAVPVVEWIARRICQVEAAS